MRLSRQLKPLASVDATHIWDVVEDRQGSLFVATGDAGKIYKVAPDGKVSVASVAWTHHGQTPRCAAAPAAAAAMVISMAIRAGGKLWRFSSRVRRGSGSSANS